MQPDITIENIKTWFYQNDTDTLYRIRTPDSANPVFANEVVMSKDDAFEKLLKHWGNLGEGTYRIEMKESKNGKWTLHQFFTKGTPSNLSKAVHGIGSTTGNMYGIGTTDNKAFDFLTAQLAAKDTMIQTLQTDINNEREKRRDAEQSLLLLKMKKKKNKGALDKMLTPEGLQGIAGMIAAVKSGGIRTAAIASVQGDEPVDATIKEPGTEQNQSLQQQRWMTKVITAVSGIQNRCPELDFATILELLEEKAAANPDAFAQKIQTALSFL